MAIAGSRGNVRRIIDKVWIRAWLEAEGHSAAFPQKPNKTSQKVRQMMAHEGIRTEDNLFSQSIIATREEHGPTEIPRLVLGV